MFGWLKKKKEPSQDWRLVITLNTDVKLTDRSVARIYYHLFESNTGNKRCDIEVSQDFSQWETAAKRLTMYQEEIFPWLHGRYVAKIPHYADVEALDVQKKLSE